MFFLNLGVGEFFVLLGAAASVITALYLLDRNRSKLLVSTLRFWPESGAAAIHRSRYRVQDPWSLLLQLLSLALLLLAIADLEWGRREGAVRNHVLVLDTSSASAERTANGTVLEEEKRKAREYLDRLGTRDRVMLVEAAGLLMPRTTFTAGRTELERRIEDATSSYSGLDIDQALAFASRAELRAPGEAGEIVYIGPQRITTPATVQVRNLRVIPVTAPQENRGITAVRVRRDPEPNTWAATVNLRNYGDSTARLVVHVSFGASTFAPRLLTINPHGDGHADYRFVADAAGELRVRLDPGDSFRGDDQASISLPRNGAVQVSVFTNRAQLLQPLLNANPRLSVHYYSPSQYRSDGKVDVMLLDQFAPPVLPSRPSLWIDPPEHNSPLPIRSTIRDKTIDNWTFDPELGRGLHSHDMRLSSAHGYQTFAGDLGVATVDGEAVAVAQEKSAAGVRLALTGFDVLTPELRYQVSSPLLIANLLRWLTPAGFESQDIACEQDGIVNVQLESGEDAGSLRVVDDRGRDLPFSVRRDNLQFFVDRPSTVRVISTGHERLISAVLPQVGPVNWRPEAASVGLPNSVSYGLGAVQLWRYLAIAAAILLAIEWVLFARPRSALRLGLKVVAAGLLAAALLAPVVRVPAAKVATVALVDMSASVGSADLARSAELVRELAARRGSNWLSVIPFAAQPRRVSDSESLHLLRVSRPAEMGTDLEAALTDAMASIPSGYVPRIVLISDGNENQGSVARAMTSLQRLHVPVDVVPLSGRSLNNVTISSVALPGNAYEGEQIPVTLTIESPSASSGSLDFSAEGKLLGSESIELTRGSNIVHARVRIKAAGPVVLAGNIKTAQAGEAHFDQALQIRRGRILYLSQDSGETETNLRAILESAEFDVTQDLSLLDAGLHDIQLVILNNVDLNTLSEHQKEALEQYVSNGGGLLLLGGEHQVYKEDKLMDALDRVLPADLAPPRNPEGICVALIIDKSSSMEGRKIELARLSAIGVVDHLREKDTIGVLIFDNSYQWAVPMRKAVDKESIRRLISGITPDGGTQIAPALSEAYRKVQRTDSAYKHVVLLTDGISEEGDSMDLAREAQAHRVTISTVGLGQDVNRAYLEKIAASAGGKSYFLNNPQGLEQILLKDVEDYTGSTAVERAFLPLVKRKAEILDDVDIEHAPALRGYARYQAKPGADTLLTINPEKQDPLYVSWQYGLGRAAVWASDAKSRWASAWLSWPGYDKFWTNVTRDLISHRSDTTASAEFDPASGDLIVTYRLAEGIPEPGYLPPLYVLGPQGFAEQITIRRLATGVYQGRVRVGWRSGFFRIRPLTEMPLLPEIGVYRVEEEVREHGPNDQVLREIASVTGGRFDVAPATVFDANGRVTYLATELWPLLLSGVVLLTIAELAVRKRRVYKGRRQRS